MKPQNKINIDTIVN